MLRAWVRGTVAVVSGAVAGGLLLLFTYPFTSTVAFEMDRDLPSFLSGGYAVERSGDLTFVWTSSRLVLRLEGLDRREAWTCRLRVRGARDASLPQPSLVLSYDGAGGETTRLTNDFDEVAIAVPPRPGRSGLTLTADVGPTFVPGGGDPRELGAQIDWLRCATSAWVLPPAAALRSAAVGTAALALAAVATAAPLTLALALVLTVGLGQGLLLSTGGGAFGAYPSLALTLAIGTAAAIALVAWAPALARRPRLAGPALAAVVLSAALALLKLEALEHPAKMLVDAIFHAHRLEWVMAGRYFFTQPLPDGVQFPYAIGLYATAAPLASLVTDHVLLLRLVVVVAEAIGGALLYVVVARGFADRVAGVLAVVLFHVVPLPFVVMGNANLTNAFAEAVANAGLCALALLPFPLRTGRAWALAAGVCLLTALAFLSHIGTIVLMAGVLGVSVVAFLLPRRPDSTRLALFVVLMTMLAGGVAVGLYYRHFSDVFVTAFERVLAPADVAAQMPGPAGTAALDTPAVLSRQLTWRERSSASASQTVADLGWPLLLLAVAGGALRFRTWRERVPLLLMAWVAAWAIFLIGSTLTRVDTDFQRYAAEFVARVNLDGYPAIVALAALGATTMWRWGIAGRVVALGLVAAASGLGVMSWLRWLQ